MGASGTVAGFFREWEGAGIGADVPVPAAVCDLPALSW